MKKTLFISLLLTACGGSLPDFDCAQSFDAGGMTFCLESEVDDIKVDMVEDLVSLIEQEVQKRYPQVSGVRNMLQTNGTLVVVTSATLVSGCQEIKATGFYACDNKHGALIQEESGPSFVMMPPPKNGNCFADRHLMHEILHSVIWHFIDGSDSDHDRPYFFGRTDQESIEHKMEMVIYNELRPLYPEQCETK